LNDLSDPKQHLLETHQLKEHIRKRDERGIPMRPSGIIRLSGAPKDTVAVGSAVRTIPDSAPSAQRTLHGFAGALGLGGSLLQPASATVSVNPLSDYAWTFDAALEVVAQRLLAELIGQRMVEIGELPNRPQAGLLRSFAQAAQLKVLGHFLPQRGHRRSLSHKVLGNTDSDPWSRERTPRYGIS